MSERHGWATSPQRGVAGWFDRRWQPLVLGLGAGLVGGMAGFVDTRSALMPMGELWWFPIALVLLSGVYPAILATRSLRMSIGAMVLGLVVGVAIICLAWIAPAYLLDYPPEVRGVLVVELLRQGLAGAIGVFMGGYLLSYLTVVTVIGTFDL